MSAATASTGILSPIVSVPDSEIDPEASHERGGKARPTLRCHYLYLRWRHLENVTNALLRAQEKRMVAAFQSLDACGFRRRKLVRAERTLGASSLLLESPRRIRTVGAGKKSVK